MGIIYLEHKVKQGDGTSQLHSTNDKPARVWTNGTEEWFHDGKRHRTTGPAVVVNCNMSPVASSQNATFKYAYYLDDEPLTREAFVQQYEMTYLEEYKGI